MSQLSRRGFLVLLAAVAASGCSRPSVVKDERSQLEDLIADAKQLDTGAYAHDWVTAIQKEVAEAEEALGVEDSGYRPLNDARTSLEKTLSLAVPLPESWDSSTIYGTDEELPSYNDIVSQPDSFIGCRFVFSGNYISTDRYEVGGYETKVLTTYDDESVYIEHYPTEIASRFSRFSTELHVSGWLSDVANDNLYFMADSIEVEDK